MNLHPRHILAPHLSALEAARAPFGFADMFKLGIGPSSSHTVGPMKAAGAFRARLTADRMDIVRVVATAHGSLAWTGKGHGTDKALVLGLCGEQPETIDPDVADALISLVAAERRLHLPDRAPLDFDPTRDVVLDFGAFAGRHPNAMTFEAFDAAGTRVLKDLWYSVGGGFIEREGGEGDAPLSSDVAPAEPAFRYANATSLLATTQASGISIEDVALANEDMRRDRASTLALVDRIADAMSACVDRGLAHRGTLPGGLKVRRRAADIHARLLARTSNQRAPAEAMEYVSVFAMAVNEENAAGGRVVTAPTNGAAGVVPAILRYHRDFCGGGRAEARTILLTASAVGDLVKRNASISGAEVGCQGEVGSASAMAAAGLCAASGGDPEQVLNAAEIALEHHLGMTCDPIGGLVQIPCIERNAFGAVKAITASALALHGTGPQKVSLDQVVETMRQTGLDMNAAYRETARGGLAVNVPEC